MAKLSKFTINEEIFFEDLIWMSTRYCIGRGSIAAVSHAHKIARNCYNQMADVFKEKLAEDIRREIDSKLKWFGNIQINNITSDVDNDCAFLICDALSKTDPEEILWKDTKFVVDKLEKTVTKTTSLDCATQKITMILQDYLPWSKLANALDKKKHKMLVIKNGDSIETKICFPYIIECYSAETNYSYMIAWCSIDRYLSTSIDTYIDPNSIVEIKDIV